MTQPKKIVPKERAKERDAFLIYFELGGERSIRRVQQEFSKGGIKTSDRTIAKWSKKFEWVSRVGIMDQQAASKAEELAIKESTAKKSDILKAVKNTMIKYNQLLFAGEIVPTASDFKKMWEILRTETGQTTGGQSEMPPPVNIFLTKNTKIIKVVEKAEGELREILREELTEE